MDGLRVAGRLGQSAAGKPRARGRRSRRGRGGGACAARYHLPLIRNALLASWLLIFLVFVREYATGVYLLAPGTEVMGSLLVSLWENGMADLVAPLAVVNVAIIGAGLVIANRLGVRLHG